ncbi:hypothetical protein ACKKBG_A13250 [Auxenochlorella protothecoides x Auxenochlorella symbiontica]
MLLDTWNLPTPSRQTAGLLVGTAVAAAALVGGAVLFRRRPAPRPCTVPPPPAPTPASPRASLNSRADLDDLRAGAIDPGSVEEARLAGCGLTANDLATLRPLHSLRFLDLGNNGLEYIASGFLPGFPCLEVLNLAGNRLRELPEDVGDLPRLRRLGLKGNRLTCLPPSIGRLRALVELFLTDNALTALPASIGGLESLVKLQASFNELATLPPELARLTRLELLRAACCRLTHLPPALASLPSLCWLSLAGNPLAPEPSPAGRGLPPTIPFTDLTLGQRLGCGASGEVFRATWGAREVALKLFVGEVSPDGRAADEESVACALADPCLVRVLARTAEPWGLVLELVEGQPLAAKPDHKSLLRCTWAPGTRYTLAVLLRIAHSVAVALAYLHARGIAHGDVYAHNVLAGPCGKAVLCDYGASFRYDRRQDSHYELQEVRAYALMLSGLMQHLDIGFSDMEVALSTQKALLALVQACRTPDPAKRPRFAAIAARIRSFQLSSKHAGATSREQAAETLRSSRVVLSARSEEST